MSSLINRIQRAMLGSAGPEKVRALLAELQIPAGGSGPNALREVRRGFLRPISDEAILRDGLANLGLTGGGGGGAQALSSIRTALMHNLVDSETTLRDGLDGLLVPGDLGEGGGGGGETPAWVPADAKIHIDLVGGTPQGRAWIDGTGEVAVDTLLGADSHTENAWGTTSYSAGDLTADGLVRSGDPPALIGAARSAVLAGATIRYAFKILASAPNPADFLLMSADGNDALDVESGAGLNIYSWGGSASQVAGDLFDTSTVGAINVIAATIVGTRLEAAGNGSEPLALTLVDADRPAANPLVAALLDAGSTNHAMQSITIYDPLPDTTGLSDLSEVV